MSTEQKEMLIKQIKAVQRTGKANMFDVNAVARIAKQLRFTELCTIIQKYESKYIGFIMSGDESSFDGVTLD